jgi:dihydrofolate synthase / folylpolyglutamate synthase
LNFDETLEYLYTLLPMYQRVGAIAFKKDLTNIITLCEHLDNPQSKIKSIHVAGTNGKGSVTHILAAVAMQSGYKTGYYTSPHLVDFRERIKIDGKMIAKAKVVAFVQDNQAIIEKIQPSFFEITVAMAFDHFAKENVDIAIIETGLGGRLDSTNIIQPILSVITNIGHDHMDMLGDTLEKIAFEKAGIIKSSAPVVIGEKQVNIAHVFQAKADKCKTSIHFDDKSVHTSIESDLRGAYQQKNLNTAKRALEVLENECGMPMRGWNDAVRQVSALTGFAGRWQKLSDSPLLIADTAHNAEGIKEVLNNLDKEEYQNLHIIFGMVAGKNYRDILSMFPSSAKYYLVEPKVPRALEIGLLKLACKEFGYEAKVYDSIGSAYEEAERNSMKDDCIFVGGSTFTVADFLGYYQD